MKTYLKPIGLGFMGMVLALGLWVVGVHLYQDHANLHGLVELEVHRQQAAKGQ